ncbi:MAG TPA: S8 family serine peptidase, partial [Thermoanaerobaculia bacterium]|nr:S8 family serine peptidase [Thermoanaerobaculia bacterium]
MTSVVRVTAKAVSLAAILIVAILFAALVPAVSAFAAVDIATPPSPQTVTVFVELSEPPTVQAWAAVMQTKTGKGPVGTPPDQGLLQRADAAGQAQRLRIVAEQGRFSSAMQLAGIQAQVVYQVAHVLNGFALTTSPDMIPRLRKLPGVKNVQIMEPEYPTNSSSVPFLQTPKVWENSLGLPQGYTGTGVRIAVIDTGLDYQHANFGGTGLLADYQANDRTVAPDAYFPTPKVIDGFDFAGDAYTGSNAPVPDNDPMDCNGHGSHVAGTAAGLGVASDGTTFTGPYTSGAPYAGLRIGPGTAPGASLISYRVFGCGGSTNLTVNAINRAMDPNGDNNLSDHVDVINMSLGSNFGTLSNTSSAASDNAALAGVIVVASAGNAGDTYYISGAPGAAARAIATASSIDSGINVTVVQVNAPGGIAGGYAAQNAGFTGPTPPAPSGQTADVVLGLDAADGAGPLTTDACSPLTNAAAVAGKIAIVDRGTCGFQVKVANVQAAGAIGCIVSNNVPGDSTTLISMGNTAGQPAITIPSVFVATTTGDMIKANLAAPVNATLNIVPGSDVLSTFSSRGPRLSTAGLKPDIAAPGQSITSTQTGVTCTAAAQGCLVANATGYIAGSTSLTISGTSMASPHMAGIMALLRQEHPDWSVEELKALAMNGASHDVSIAPNGPKFPSSRVGSGRVDPPNSAVRQTVAFNANDAGTVSAAFFNEFTSDGSATKTIRVENKGTSSVTYDLAIQTKLDAPGMGFSLPGGSSLTINAGETALVDVNLDATRANMDHVKELTVNNTQTVTVPASLANLAIPRHYLTEESAVLVFSIAGVEKMRVPLFSAARPASTMSAPPAIITGGAPTGSTTIPLAGADVCTGTLGAGPTCTGTFPDTQSLVSPFELQVVSPRNPSVPPSQDLQYAGVAADATRIWFGLTTWGDWSSLQQTQFVVYIDNNLDGTFDRQIGHASSGNLARTFFGAGSGQSDTDAQIVSVVTLPGTFSNTIAASTPNFVNRVTPAQADTVLYNTNVLFMGATPAQLGLANVNAPFRYKIETCPGNAPWCQAFFGFHSDDAVGPFFWSGAARGLDFSNGSNLLPDLNGGSVPVTWNVANMTTNGSVGALLLHHHNAAGRRAQIVPLDTAPSVDLSITAGSAPSNPPLNSNIVVTVNLTNPSATPAANVQVNVPLPAGLTWVSDNSAGTYNAGTGIWTVAALPTGTQTLNITATVITTDPLDVLAQITGGTPFDPNPANNQSSFVVSAPRSADLVTAMSTSGATAFAGTPISYTITVTNGGNDPAYSIDVADSFPTIPGLAPTTANPSQGVFDMPSKTWNLAGLGKGNSATIVLGLNAPNMAGALQNSATASASTADPNAANNTDTKSIQILSPSNVNGIKNNSGQSYIGGTMTYSITLTNSGSYDQQDNPGAEYTDVLPSTMTLVSANATSGTAVATIGTNTVTWNGSIAASGGTVTITITATVNNTAVPGNTITNTATISYDADGDGINEATRNPSSNFVVTSPATVTATKTVAGQFYPGGTVTYTVVLTNNGPAVQFDNVANEFADILPSSLVIVSANATSGTTNALTVTNAATWNGSIPVSGTVTITITATVAPSATAGSTISNQGNAFYDANGDLTNEATAPTDNPSTGTAGDATSFTVVSPANMTATKTVAGQFYPNGTVTYTVVLTNNGPAAQLDNPGNEFSDILPSSLALVSANATSGTASANTGTNTVLWNGSIPVSGTVTITITATVAPSATAGSTISNQGNAFYDANGDGTNEATAPTDNPSTGTAGDATSFTVITPANLTATKTVTGQFYPGGTVTYTIVMTNNGPSTQVNDFQHEFTDTVPAGITPVTANATSGTAAILTGPLVAWDGSLANGASVTITFTATVNAGVTAGTIISNQGSAHPDTDGDQINDGNVPTDDPTTQAAGDATSFTVISPATITANKTVSGQLRAGGTIAYTVVLSNSGVAPQQNNSGNEFIDVLPAQLTLVSANATSGSAVATVGTNTVTWNGSIPASGSVTITINATVAPNATALSTISNQGSFNYDADGDGTNEASGVTNDPGTGAANDATSFVVLSPANISEATKSVTGAYYPGSVVTYSILLRNTGTSTQLDNPTDEFTDTVPASLTVTNVTATSGTAAHVGNAVTWNGSLASSATVTITITATVSNSATQGTIVSNQGVAHYDADGNGSNEATRNTDNPSTGTADDATDFTVVSPSGISAPSKTVAGSFRANTNVTYTISIHNGGPGAQLDNPGDEFTDTLPASLALVSANASSGTAVADIPNRVVHWNGSIANGADVTITITATILGTNAPLSSISNQGTFFADADGNGTNETSIATNDPGTPAPGDATSFSVTSPANIASATMSASGSFAPGSNVTYTVVINNG